MTDNGWICDSCQANNLSGTAVCRLCQQPAGSVTGVVAALPESMPLTRYHEPTPVFGRSKHETIVLTPVPVKPPAPPRPTGPRPTAPRPAPPPRLPVRTPRSGAGRRLIKVFLVLLAVFIIAVNWPKLVALLPKAARSATTQQTACPALVAKWFPGGDTSAVLVDAYTTPRFVITLCLDSAGQLYYDGQVAGGAVNSSTHISIPAEQTSDGFVAYNKGYEYRISGTTETVAHNGKVDSTLSLTRTGP